MLDLSWRRTRSSPADVVTEEIFGHSSKAPLPITSRISLSSVMLLSFEQLRNAFLPISRSVFGRWSYRKSQSTNQLFPIISKQSGTVSFFAFLSACLFPNPTAHLCGNLTCFVGTPQKHSSPILWRPSLSETCSSLSQLKKAPAPILLSCCGAKNYASRVPSNTRSPSTSTTPVLGNTTSFRPKYLYAGLHETSLICSETVRVDENTPSS